MERSQADVYMAFDVITCNIQETDNLGVSCKQEVRDALDDYFNLIARLKNTPLWDVLQYEKKLEAPISILTADNERLKKENNKLLGKLKKTQKYKVHETIDEKFRVGDLIYSKNLKTVGTIYRPSCGGLIFADFDMRNGTHKNYACEPSDVVLIERKEAKK